MTKPETRNTGEHALLWRGTFVCFARRGAGAERLVLATEDGETALRVSPGLRRALAEVLRPGEALTVSGPAAEPRRATRVSVLATGQTIPAPRAAVCLRVCAKANCWTSGGRELWEAVAQAIAARGLAGQVSLRRVQCLGKCLEAPCVARGRERHGRCTPEGAVELLASVAHT